MRRQVWYACDDQNEAAHFHDRDRSDTSVRRDSYQAGRANEMAHIRDGNVKTARARKYISVLDILTTIGNLGVLTKATMAIKPRSLVDAMTRSQQPPSFDNVSPSVNTFFDCELRLPRLQSCRMSPLDITM